MPSLRPLGVTLLAVAVVALAAGCASSPRESSDVANNSMNETNTSTPTLPGFNTTAGQGETPVQPPLTSSS